MAVNLRIDIDYAFYAAYRFTHNGSSSDPMEAAMAIMCSLAACKAQAGMCGHEKVMLSVAALAAFGLGAYFLIS
jgi:hypothetical protein